MMNFFGDANNSPSTGSPSGGGQPMFNFFGGAADDSTSGQNDDGEGGAGFLAALFGKGADAGQNDSQPADIFSSTFFDGSDADPDHSLNADDSQSLPFFMRPPTVPKQKSGISSPKPHQAKADTKGTGGGSSKDNKLSGKSQRPKSSPIVSRESSGERGVRYSGGVKAVNEKSLVADLHIVEKKPTAKPLPQKTSDGISMLFKEQVRTSDEKKSSQKVASVGKQSDPQTIQKRQSFDLPSAADNTANKKRRASPELMPPPNTQRSWVHPMQKINEHSPTGPTVEIAEIPLKPSKENKPLSAAKSEEKPKSKPDMRSAEMSMTEKFLDLDTKPTKWKLGSLPGETSTIEKRPIHDEKLSKERHSTAEPMKVKEKFFQTFSKSSTPAALETTDDEIVSGSVVRSVEGNRMKRFEALLREEEQDCNESIVIVEEQNCNEQHLTPVNASIHPAMDSTFNQSAADSSHNDSGTATAEEFTAALMMPEYEQLREHLSNLPAAKASGNFVFQVASSVDALFKCTQTEAEKEQITLGETQSFMMSRMTNINDVLNSQLEECNAMHQALIDEKLSHLSSILDEIKTNQEELNKYKKLLRALSMDVNEQ